MNVDAEKWADGEEDIEGEELAENPADIEPRFFRSPSADLIPSAASAAAIRRRSSIKSVQRDRQPSVGGEPGNLLRRSSLHRKSISSPDRRPPRGPPTERSFEELSSREIELGELLDARKTAAGEDEELTDTIRFGGEYTLEDIKDELRGLCTLQTLQRKIPITAWITKYSRTDLMGDVVAGLTVGLTVVPQCLAYAQIANIKLEYGLNSAYMGCFIYALLGSSKDVTVGPTAILSLLTGAFIRREAGQEGEWAIMLCFLVGCFQLLMGFLRLGFLINFISTPVVSGFTQAAVIVIILSQIKNMMGVVFGSAKDNIVDTLAGYVRKLPDTNGWDVLMGSFCITLLLLMREMKMPDWRPSSGNAAVGSPPPPPPKWWSAMKETIRLIGVSRYAIVVVCATAFEFIMQKNGVKGILSVTGNVTASISAPKPPNFAIEGMTFVQILGEFGSGLVLVPLLATMESIAVAKTFAQKFRYNIDTTQEFLALGAANVVSSFFGSYPVTGAFTRSALNAESGVRTPMGCIVTGTFVVVAILSLGSMFQYIPKAALAAVIICACLTMFDFQIFRELWYIRKSELFVLLLTMLSCLFLRVEYGLLIGLTVSILMLVYPMARPVVIISRRRHDLKKHVPKLDECKIIVTPQGAIFFPAAEYLKEIFNDALFSTPVTAYAGPRESYVNGMAISAAHPDRGANALVKGGEEMKASLAPIIFDGIHLTTSDYSALRALRSVFVNCKAAHRDIVFINTSDEILDIIMPFRKTTVAPPIKASNKLKIEEKPSSDNDDEKRPAQSKR